MEQAWKQTHEVILSSGEKCAVMLDDEGRAYTHQEWDACDNADIERRPDGTWTFSGDPTMVVGFKSV